jgi:hypothetical protein
MDPMNGTLSLTKNYLGSRVQLAASASMDGTAYLSVSEHHSRGVRAAGLPLNDTERRELIEALGGIVPGHTLIHVAIPAGTGIDDLHLFQHEDQADTFQHQHPAAQVGARTVDDRAQGFRCARCTSTITDPENAPTGPHALCAACGDPGEDPAPTLPQYPTIPAALVALDAQDDPAAYLAGLQLKGVRESCGQCIIAVYLLATVTGLVDGTIGVQPVNDFGRRQGSQGAVHVWTEPGPDDREDEPAVSIILTDKLNALAYAFDDEKHPELDRRARRPGEGTWLCAWCWEDEQGAAPTGPAGGTEASLDCDCCGEEGDLYRRPEK